MPLTGDAKRQYQREWVATRRAAWFADKRCVDCGARENLELDHRDPAEKISHKIWSWSWKRIEVEVAKCDVRCHRCHEKRHGKEERHGMARYNRKGCRCEICKAAKAVKAARRRARRPGS